MSDNLVTYKKVNPSEQIDAGDIIMLDPSTGYIKKAVLEKPWQCGINSSLVVGICIDSDNATPPTKNLDGGKCKDLNRVLLSGGTAERIDTLLLIGGTSEQNTREIIQVAYTGEQVVNLCGPVHIGDRLCISNQPGKAKSKDFIGQDYYEEIRSIGKVVRISSDKKQAKVLLDIE